MLGAHAAADTQVGLPLVTAQVQHLEGAKILAGSPEAALNPDQALAGRVNREAPQIGREPLPAETLGDSSGCAGTAEKSATRSFSLLEVLRILRRSSSGFCVG